MQNKSLTAFYFLIFLINWKKKLTFIRKELRMKSCALSSQSRGKSFNPIRKVG